MLGRGRSDLHELEETAGFEVFWLPTDDETAPALDAMEKGLEWLRNVCFYTDIFTFIDSFDRGICGQHYERHLAVNA